MGDQIYSYTTFHVKGKSLLLLVSKLQTVILGREGGDYNRQEDEREAERERGEAGDCNRQRMKGKQRERGRESGDAIFSSLSFILCLL